MRWLHFHRTSSSPRLLWSELSTKTLTASLQAPPLFQEILRSHPDTFYGDALVTSVLIRLVSPRGTRGKWGFGVSDSP